jgi:hypothetical protein
VRNKGTGVLCVLDVQTGCGCVKAEWVGAARVEPGGRGTLKVRVDTSGRTGIEDRPVTLYLNDPARRSLAIPVHLEVRLGLIVASGGGHTVTFGTRPVGRPASAGVRLRCPKDEPPWEVLAVESAGGVDGKPTEFAWRVEPAEAESPEFREQELVLTRPPSDRLGIVNERVRVRTSHPERPEILLDTQILVVTKYYAQPKDVRLLRVRPQGVNVKTVFVFPGEPGTPFRVTGARVEGAGFVAAEPRQVPEGWAVDVRYDGQGRAAGRIKATLVVGVEDAELPEVRVPLEAEVVGS